MMTFRKRTVMAVATAAAALLALSACAGGPSEVPGPSEGTGGASGEPVVGGVGRVAVMNEPRSLDPALMGNSGPNNAFVGNALYGTLWINDAETNELEFKLAESFETEDGGKTFTLLVRDGVEFSDGTPFTAEAIAYNWDRIKDPATSSPDAGQAALIESTEVIDDRTLEVTLVDPVPAFAHAVLTTSLNWIGKPDVLEQGQTVVDEDPIGAGPYTLESWARQDVLKLVRNDNYWDSPRPYLDAIEVRGLPDAEQRYNNLSTGAADVIMETNFTIQRRAEEAALPINYLPLGGGVGFVLNTSRPPFDDVRARQAVSYAFNQEAMNLAVFENAPEPLEYLFPESSPFFQDIPVQEYNPEKAQELFDELAAEGKPLSFTHLYYPRREAQGVAESLQAQLSAFDNVEVKVELLDIAQAGVVTSQGQFDSLPSSVVFSDPEPRLWFALHSTSGSNFSKINDPRLDAALDAGRLGETVEERAEAYGTVQELVAELVPIILYNPLSNSAISNDNVGGVKQYGMGSLIPEDLWINPGE